MRDYTPVQDVFRLPAMHGRLGGGTAQPHQICEPYRTGWSVSYADRNAPRAVPEQCECLYRDAAVPGHLGETKINGAFVINRGLSPIVCGLSPIVLRYVIEEHRITMISASIVLRIHEARSDVQTCCALSNHCSELELSHE